MGFLEDLKKRMSTPGAERYGEERFRAARPALPEVDTASQKGDEVPPLLVDVEAERKAKITRSILSSFVVVALLIVAGGVVWGVRFYRLARVVRTGQVRIVVDAPEKIQSGSDVRYHVTVQNDSRVTWENVVMEAKLPAGFSQKEITGEPVPADGVLQWTVGKLSPRQSSDVTVSGRLVGEVGDAPSLVVHVALTPSTRPGKRVEKTQLATVRVDALPVDVAVEAPKNAASGERIQIRIAYQNRTAEGLSGVRVMMTPPSGFVLEEKNPETIGQDLTWDLPAITPQGQGAITMTGYIKGNPDAVLPFRVLVGFVAPDGTFLKQQERQATTTIARRALTITQTFNGKRDILHVNPGGKVEAQIGVKNSGDVGLRDVIVKLVFDGRGLNPASVETKGGFYNSQENSIEWSASSIPALKALSPGETATLSLRFLALTPENLPFTGPQDKDFSLVIRVTADSPDIPTPVGAKKEVISDRFEILLNTVLGLSLTAFYDDGRAGLPVSTGPKQPEVGKESVYTIRVRVTNTSNDVVDAVHRTVLPEGIHWTGKYYVSSGKVSFNERSREILWTLNAVPSRAGSATLSPEFAFQVGLTPSLNQVGRQPTLMREHSVEGTDVFTAEKVRATGPAVTTEDVAGTEHGEVLRESAGP